MLGLGLGVGLGASESLIADCRYGIGGIRCRLRLQIHYLLFMCLFTYLLTWSYIWSGNGGESDESRRADGVGSIPYRSVAGHRKSAAGRRTSDDDVCRTRATSPQAISLGLHQSKCGRHFVPKICAAAQKNVKTRVIVGFLKLKNICASFETTRSLIIEN